MRSPAETSETRDKLDALAADAEAKIGPVDTVTCMMGHRGQYDRSDADGPITVLIRFQSIKLDACTTRAPEAIFAYGHCDLSAIEAAHREIARRVLEEQGEAA